MNSRKENTYGVVTKRGHYNIMDRDVSNSASVSRSFSESCPPLAVMTHPQINVERVPVRACMGGLGPASWPLRPAL